MSHVSQDLLQSALPLWLGCTSASLELLNVSENIMYRVVTEEGSCYVLRVHRQNNNRKAIESELAWIEALQADSVLRTPDVILGLNGKAIQSIKRATNGSELFLVMFAYIEGREPNEADDVLAQFHTLGEIAAQTHIHSLQWTIPLHFERGSWNADTLLGNHPVWGRWQDAPGINQEQLTLLTRLRDTVVHRLNRLGQHQSIYGLIHADMRRANLLIHAGTTRLIDFDDCGFGWFMYDFATAISFIENHPRLPELKIAWLNGYRLWRQPSELEVQELDTFIMLRRLALLAWMGGHPEVAVVQELQGDFASVTCELADAYLSAYY